MIEVSKIHVLEHVNEHTNEKVCRIYIGYYDDGVLKQSFSTLTHPFDTKILARVFRQIAYEITHK